MKTMKGDLLHLARQGHFDVIVHGCNCFRRMDAGIARQIQWEYPEAYETDCLTPLGDEGKLGTINLTETKDGFTIVNAYTQYGFGAGKVHANYKAILECFRLIARRFPESRIGYPMIGAGLARGDWNIIYPIIKDALYDMDHTLVIYEPDKIL